MLDNERPVGRPDNERPATPFLFIPKDDTARPGSERDPNSVGWIKGPAIFLINSDGRFEWAPRFGVDYRIMVLIGNAGAVPSQQVFAEFCLGRAPINEPAPLEYSEDPIDLSRDAHHLGVAALSIPQAVDNTSLSWALSPKSYRFQWDPTEYTAIVKVGDLLHDAAPKAYASRHDRHTAFRTLVPNFSGVWEGIEEEETTHAAVGPVKLEITQEWDIQSLPGLGAAIPTYTIIVRELTALPDRLVDLKEHYSDCCDDTQITLPITAGESPWQAVLALRSAGTLEMRIDKGNAMRSRVLLQRTAAGSPLPAVNRALLQRIRLIPQRAWPTSRQLEAEMLRDAIAHL